jgi:hypothetical protein
MDLENDKSDYLRYRSSTKNIQNNESYKKLMTQKQLELKAKTL